MPPVIEVSRASKTRPDGQPLLSRIDLSVAAGESVAIIGRSGSGKSTLLSILGVLDDFDSGTYRLLGHDVGLLRDRDRARFRASTVGFVFQNFSLISHLNVRENVMVAGDHIASTSRAGRRRAEALLEALGIKDLAGRRPRNLSGGEQQRAAIARALFAQPSLILADEPTGSLDVNTGEVVIGELLNVTRAHGAALVLVTHDISNASRADRTLRIDNEGLSHVTLDRQLER